MSILKSKISSFNSTRETEVVNHNTSTIELWLERFKNGTYKKSIEKLRATVDGEIKKDLPTVAFHGIFEHSRSKKSFIEASGIIILDIDDIDPDDNLEEIKQDIIEYNKSVLAVMISPSGDGLKVLYLVEPFLINADNYRQIGKQLVNDFTLYGKVDYLSVTDCLIATYDPNLLINEKAVPAMVVVENSITHKVEIEPLDKSKKLWDDAEDFFDTVLALDIQNKASNNFHYIQIAVFDMAKYGFKHPKEDLSFIIHYAEDVFKKSKDNQKRFNECVAIAKDLPHTMWAYNTSRDDFFDDDEDFEPDYSEYVPKSKPRVKTDCTTNDNEEEEQEDDDGLIEYSTFFERVLTIAKEGNRVGCEISLKSFSNVFRFRGSGILTVTGIPGSGKTEFVDQCILDLARLFKHETIIAGFEQTPEEHIIKLAKKLVGTDVTCPSYLKSNEKKLKEAVDFLTQYVKHIDVTKIGGNITKILEVSAKRIYESRENGGDPKYLILDPFNMLSIKSRSSGHEKIEEILRLITQFSHQMKVMVILVAHPFKMKKDEKTGKYEVPDFYSVKGSSAFFEMSYHGIVVHRTGYQSTDCVLVRILKVKQNNLGVTNGEVLLSYDRNSGRYIPIDAEGNEEAGDHRDKDWLQKAK